MKKQQAGFTLIELVVVIVLLGILGAAATARFQNLNVQAGNAAAAGVAGELASASAINFAVDQANGTTAPLVAINTATACTTAGLVGLLQQTAFPANITVADGADLACTGAGDTKECLIGHTSGDTTSIATLLCTGA